MKNEAQRIYVGDCGCVRIESKHSRTTMQIEQFVDLLRNLVKKQSEPAVRQNALCFQKIKITNNVSSSGFVTLARKRGKQK